MRLGPIEIWRSMAGPNADGALRLIVTLSENANERVARTALQEGRELLAEVATADQRLDEMLDRFGSRWELVADNGMGTTLLATASADGELAWTAIDDQAERGDARG